MKKIRVMSIFGTRPEAIKMAPVIMKMRERAEFEPITVVTGQHREMLDQVLKIFKIIPDFDLNIMAKSQTLSQITERVMKGLDPIIEKCKPDIILVHGDTTTTFASGISAFYHQVAIGHVEAGLRTWNKYSPYPEEMNRQMTDVLADLYFAPTSTSKANLKKENHAQANIYITGNTAIDALKQTVDANYHHEIVDSIKPNNRIVLVTMHRRENQGKPMERVFRAIKVIVDAHSDVEVIFPVHLNPKVQQLAKNIFGNDPKIHLTTPLDVIDFHNIAAISYFIMTDSGGVQEEAPSLGKPVLVLRNTTERPEGIDAGTLKLVGTDPEVVSKTMLELLDNKNVYDKMAGAKNPYGDGKAADRILDAIVEWKNRNNE
ncbi:non-hydrolyzing UDP-N-acetylglucosamine 2-epimerase [Pediococcus parvulus]|uniref:non-hydrolyzing UDP-N-acetylglucosamine 2-epimerase n=1 Tax=Pediococcus parvulus TaxID=54062 RepID=UPI0021A36B43|nr:UDP-N-acetylglucosamine 2-epimerase (non-hydrolyzing) [Pediococcus parvulus]MCT3034570.1 UDP-N-acetylglucosamine 2-epimerase (non-hydrolyzing) [Pediococcus parvulus]